MKKRALLTAGAALLTAAAAALAVPAVAGALTTTPATASSAAAFTAAGPAAGMVAAKGSHLGAVAATGRTAPAAATAATTCTEPNCNLGYHGGPVQHTPHVYLLFWGPQWNNTSNTKMKDAKGYVNSFFGGLGKTPTDVWTQTVAQYTDKTGQPKFGTSGVLAGVRTDASTLPNSISPNQLGAEAAKAIGMFKITDVRNAEIVIMPQSGACIAPLPGSVYFAGNCGKRQSIQTAYCAYHSFDVNSSNTSLFLPWINLPFQADAQDLCNGAGVGSVTTPNVNAGYSISGGHEVAETISDPRENAWYDAADTISGGEVADKCAWGGSSGTAPFGNVRLSTGTFLMQSLWTNVINQHCTMTGKLQLTVTTPPNQNTKVNVGVKVQVHATINGRTPLRYGASGLPKGIVINNSTGLITGKPTVKGTFTVKLNVTYYAGSGLVKFTWTVS